MIGIKVVGIQSVQKRNLAAIRSLRLPVVADKMRAGVTVLHRYAVAQTHVDTGALRASHRISVEGPAQFRIHLSSSVVNPRSGTKPAVYGVYEHARGGSHAFYELTVRSQGAAVAKRITNDIVRSLPR